MKSRRQKSLIQVTLSHAQPHSCQYELFTLINIRKENLVYTRYTFSTTRASCSETGLNQRLYLRAVLFQRQHNQSVTYWSGRSNI